MPHYFQLGNIPHKRHTQFRKPDGSLYAEELFSTEGFANDYSLLYHCAPPTLIRQIDTPRNISPRIAFNEQLCHRSLQGFDIAPEKDYLDSRQSVLVNSDCQIILAAPTDSLTQYFYKNADADEMLFVHEGSGTLHTQYGQIRFEYGDYLVIPRGTIYQISFDTPDNRLFIVESNSPIVFPRRYLSENGQLMEHAPFCERDIKKPSNLQTFDEKGDFLVLIKKQNQLY
ncbi:MAG TPA: homogentisate 1,2-dioxygenase, partial [Chitinophagales bacterium]|nr:homogentisate 1,2-dioxygenase [Chitinophagales bacterium]